MHAFFLPPLYKIPIIPTHANGNLLDTSVKILFASQAEMAPVEKGFTSKVLEFMIFNEKGNIILKCPVT